MKYIFLDTETTGIDPVKNSIIQIAGYVFIDGVYKTEFNFKAQPVGFGDPETHKVIEQEALDVTQKTRAELATYPKSETVFATFQLFLERFVNKFNTQDKFFMVGYNTRFDADMIRQWFADHGEKYYGSYFWNPPIDIMQSAQIHCIEQRHLFKNFKLETVAKAFSVNPIGELHDAFVDIATTFELARKVEPVLFGGLKLPYEEEV